MFENCWVLVLVAVGVLGPLASINLKITISSNPPPKKKKNPTRKIVWCRTCTLTMVLTCYSIGHVRIDLFLPEHPLSVLHFTRVP